MHICAFLRLPKARFALILYGFEACGQLETLEPFAAGYGRPFGHERAFDAPRAFSAIDRVRLAGKDEHLLFAVGVNGRRAESASPCSSARPAGLASQIRLLHFVASSSA